jgi:chemotaxis protein methyltransferase CheR
MSGVLTDEQFEQVQAVLEDATGLVHDASRRDWLGYCLANRMTASGFASVAAYLSLLTGTAGVDERQQLIDAVTIHETHFFRNPPQIRALRQHVLPELVRRATSAGRPLRVWSAGCSTGEEAYTLAMLVRELMPMATAEHVRILGTDISRRALDVARAGRYGLRSVQMVDPLDLARWFSATADGSYLVRPEAAELVEFRSHNLVRDDPPYAAGELDLLLCRNVTIYFARSTTKALMARLHAALADGGYLFLGHSETLWQLNDAFTLVTLGDAFVYRRDAGRRGVLPERRTEAGDAPILVGERRLGMDRRRPAKKPSARQAGLTVPNWAATAATVSDGAATAATVPDGAATPATVPGAAVRAAALAAQARVALRAGRYGDAVATAARAVRDDPMLLEAHLVAGEALVNLGRDGDAVAPLRRAVYLQPECAPAQLLLAGVLDRLGEPAAAGRAYRAAAAAVAAMAPHEVTAFFGGRDAEELVQLCIRLAMQAERAARGGMNGREHR